jgi:hypothetical protein
MPADSAQTTEHWSDKSVNAHIPLLAAAVILGGCTANVEIPLPGPDHPANPIALAAPLPAPSAALAPREPVAAPAGQPMGGGHEHHH